MTPHEVNDDTLLVYLSNLPKINKSEHTLFSMVKHSACTSAERGLPSPNVFQISTRSRAVKSPISALGTKYTLYFALNVSKNCIE